MATMKSVSVWVANIAQVEGMLCWDLYDGTLQSIVARAGWHVIAWSGTKLVTCTVTLLPNTHYQLGLACNSMWTTWLHLQPHPHPTVPSIGCIIYLHLGRLSGCGFYWPQLSISFVQSIAAFSNQQVLLM